jgi:DNA repair protein RadC
MVLRSGTRGDDVISVSSRLLASAGSLGTLIAWDESDFRRHRGIGRIKALQLVTTLELARRVMQAPDGERPLLNRPEAIASFLEPFARGLQVEKFWVLCLDRKNRLQKRVEISSGTATAALPHPREVFREAVREAAAAVVCVHNHPSGDPAPSAADVQVTRQLREASRALDIDLLDHVILGRPSADPQGKGYYSFRISGVL